MTKLLQYVRRYNAAMALADVHRNFIYDIYHAFTTFGGLGYIHVFRREIFRMRNLVGYLAWNN